MEKTVFVLNGVVVGHANVVAGTPVASTIPGAVAYQVPSNSPVDVGYTVTLDSSGNPTFTAPATAYPVLSPVQFYMAFKPSERMLIKTLAGANPNSPTGIPANSPLLGGTNTSAIPIDPVIAEFWETYQLAASIPGTTIDPNMVSIQEGLAYLTTPTSPTPVVLASGRAAQISQGLAQ